MYLARRPRRPWGEAARRVAWGEGGRPHRLGPTRPPHWGPGRGGPPPEGPGTPSKTIRSLDRLHKAPKRLYRAAPNYTNPRETIQSPKTLDKDSKY